MRSSQHSNRIAGLDTVRAVAALSVVFAHLLGPSMPGISRYIFTGHPAVIAFFVVSGFCIHYPYRRQELRTAPFLAGRFLRIVPPSAVAFLMAQALGIRAYNPIDGFILWSVVCEAVYYCLYPLFLPAARRIGWPLIIAASLIASYGVAIGVGPDHYGNAKSYGPLLNWVVGLPAWLIGCYLAENLDRLKLAGNVWLWRAVTATTASILYWATINTPAGFYLTMTPFSALAACWIMAEIRSAADQGPVKMLEAVGAACFSIYLVHIIAATAVEWLVTPPIVVCALSLALVYPFYRWIEKPCHAAARRAKAKLEHLEVRRRLDEGVDFGAEKSL
ncbi:acyltransferase [Rhizobium phaseoli]|uniref:acyltransferase family protein n=1 Tax=Rhizobium phaseoli TaxID=396 RepID=UPI00049840EF|nr:acyltransferase [Rhizobium phaseoli]RDJ14221.1 acyltransferase [Rhizobium phaseoli]RDJ17471.1 acyltransferase [Rhizobium phaseoli]